MFLMREYVENVNDQFIKHWVPIEVSRCVVSHFVNVLANTKAISFTTRLLERFKHIYKIEKSAKTQEKFN